MLRQLLCSIWHIVKGVAVEERTKSWMKLRELMGLANNTCQPLFTLAVAAICR